MGEQADGGKGRPGGGGINVHERVRERGASGGGKNCERSIPEAKAGERLGKAVLSTVASVDETSKRRKTEQGRWTWALVTLASWVSAAGVAVEGGLQS